MKSKYDITVYEMSWRLGGKASSGRNLSYHDRIEEHGIHSFFGIYENAFRMVKDIYAKLNRSSDEPFSNWRDVFFLEDEIVVQENYKGEWIPWTMSRPRNSKEPGNGQILGDQYDLTTSFCNYTQLWQLNFMNSVLELLEDHPVVQQQFRELHDDVCGVRDTGRSDRLQRILPPMQQLIQSKLNLYQDDTSKRRTLMNADYYVTLLIGLLEDEVFENGLESINRFDFAEWLIRHGISEITLNSPLVRQGNLSVVYSSNVTTAYDLIIAYLHGDLSTPSLEAGTAIQIATRLILDCAGAALWRLKGPMGDLIFAPIYEVLSRQGVKFKFFHKVEELLLDATNTSIQGIRIGVTATPRNSSEYSPLVTVKGVPSWPSAPLYDQLQESEDLIQHSINLESFYSNWTVNQLTLLHGVDFDYVVLGIPIGVHSQIARQLIESNTAWKNMVDRVKTVASLSLQVWSYNTSEQLDFHPKNVIGSTYAQPMPTYCDTSVTLPLENWSQQDEPKSVFYFTGTFPDRYLDSIPESDSSYEPTAKSIAKRLCIQWYSNYIRHLWPGLTSEDAKWTTLVAQSGAQGEARFEDQYCRVNVEPSSRYVLSVKNSSKYRLSQGDSKFRNLIIVGDWTKTSLNAGAAEMATEAGVKGAKALKNLINQSHE